MLVSASYRAFASSWLVFDARHTWCLGGELRLHIVYYSDLISILVSLFTTFAKMTVATALLQAASLVSTLSQSRTNGKYSWSPMQILSVLVIPRETLCLQHDHQVVPPLGHLQHQSYRTSSKISKFVLSIVP